MNLNNMQKQVRYVFLIILVIVVFVATIYLGRVASTYFAQAGSCKAKNVKSVNVTSNGAIISWESDDATQGRVEYGVTPTSLNFTAPETASAVVHNLPLTLLTPNTPYYYLIAIGDTRCDSSGQKCEEGSCNPFSFTTVSITPPDQVVQSITPPPLTPPGQAVRPTTSLSPFCQMVQRNIGKNSKVATEWATLKTYDVDDNGIINGLDIIKCQKSGK